MVKRSSKSENNTVEVAVVSDIAKFDAETGGRVFDVGSVIFHLMTLLQFSTRGTAKAFMGNSAICDSENPNRSTIVPNYTETNVLNHALSKKFEGRVNQIGTSVNEKCCFVFSHILGQSLRDVSYRNSRPAGRTPGNNYSCKNGYFPSH